MIDYEDLNRRYAIDESLDVLPGPADEPVVMIRSEHGKACVSLHGAQVLDFTPTGSRPVLWLSDQASYRDGVAIRGGMPICWPWFGPHPDDSSLPSHGLVRQRRWQLCGSAELDDGVVECRFCLNDDAASRESWPHAFELQFIVRIGQYVDCELRMRNTSEDTVTCSAALHAYIAISEAEDVRVRGLHGRRYLDQVTGTTGTQKHAIIFDGETDRIYQDTDDIVYVDDPGYGRTVVVAKSGSRSTVVWNPWIEKTRALADVPDDAYHRFCCIEPANAAADARSLAAGAQHRLRCLIGAEPYGFSIEDLRE
ncbi:MAG: D-hexose-6-phosphate mutarotase [Planctomycetota bacterium]